MPSRRKRLTVGGNRSATSKRVPAGQSPPPAPQPIAAVASSAPFSEAERRFREDAERHPGMLWTCDAKGAATFVNRALTAFVGMEATSLNYEGWLAAIHPEDRALVIASYTEALTAQAAWSCVYRLRRADGAWTTVVDRAQPRFDEAGQFIGLIGVIREVHDVPLETQIMS